MRATGMAMEAAASLTGRRPEFTRHAVTLIDRRGTVSARRAREELGWEPRVDLEEGLRRTEQWARAEGLL
jgi:2-alkyl-3-oxoalkanoate reductase